MRFQVKKSGYICPNLQGKCRVALTHEIVYYSANIEPVCVNCEAKLQITDRKMWDSQAILVWLVFIVGCAVAASQMKLKMFPKPLQSIRFVGAVTSVPENNAVVTVALNIAGNQNQQRVIHFQTIAHTATANEDFTAVNGELIIHPDQTEAVITIPIVPDRDSMEANELFYIVLTNVEAQPRHTVVIEEEGFNKELLEKSDTVVASLSLLSADIANDIATIKALKNYLQDSLDPASEIAERYETAIINIRKAREAYLLLFNEAVDLDPVVIQASIENRLAVLERENYQLQLDSTKLMRIQLLEFLNNRIPLTDKWMEELGGLIDLPTQQDFQEI